MEEAKAPHQRQVFQEGVQLLTAIHGPKEYVLPLVDLLLPHGFAPTLRRLLGQYFSRLNHDEQNNISHFALTDVLSFLQSFFFVPPHQRGPILDYLQCFISSQPIDNWRFCDLLLMSSPHQSNHEQLVHLTKHFLSRHPSFEMELVCGLRHDFQDLPRATQLELMDVIHQYAQQYIPTTSTEHAAVIRNTQKALLTASLVESKHPPARIVSGV